MGYRSIATFLLLSATFFFVYALFEAIFEKYAPNFLKSIPFLLVTVTGLIIFLYSLEPKRLGDEDKNQEQITNTGASIATLVERNVVASRPLQATTAQLAKPVVVRSL